MHEPESDIDARARQLIRAMEGELRQRLGLRRLTVEMVGELYVRVREILAREDSVDSADRAGKEQIVDDLALAIFMGLLANDSHNAVGPDLLVGLRRSLSRALWNER